MRRRRESGVFLACHGGGEGGDKGGRRVGGGVSI